MKMNAKLQKSSRRKTIVISSIFGENSFFSSTSKNKSGSASVCEPTDDVSIPSASPSKFNQEVDTATPTAFDSMVTTRRRSARSK